MSSQFTSVVYGRVTDLGNLNVSSAHGFEKGRRTARVLGVHGRLDVFLARTIVHDSLHQKPNHVGAAGEGGRVQRRPSSLALTPPRRRTSREQVLDDFVVSGATRGVKRRPTVLVP